jgi:acetyl-CoA carboxylase biotin carboxyl carrier protein
MADQKTVKSPLPGTFYRASAPDEDPYVSNGDRVRPGDVVGLIEVMKTFNEVTADDEGVVERFLVEDGHPVDAGQPVVLLSH